MEQLKKNSVVVSSYIYDPNGFRVEKDGGKGRIDYVPLLNGEVGYRKEFSNNKEYSFIYTGGQHLARVNGVIGDNNAKKFFYHNDHQGSALAVTDENGNKVVERDFSPFGERINTDIYDETNRDTDEDDSAFTGKDWDIDTGLYYYNARWYDPEIGRFITEDSVADPNNPNEYAYCYDNPVNNIDPTGHFSMGDLGTIATVISAAAIITGDEKLGALAGAMGLFISVNSLMNWIETHRANPNQPAPDPVKKMAETTGTAETKTPVNNDSSNSQPSLAETSGAQFLTDSDKLIKKFEEYCSAELSAVELARGLANTDISLSGLITKEAKRLNIDPEVLGGVILTESSGSGIINGKLVIRFEAHVFNSSTSQEYSELFQYNSQQPWLDQQYRLDSKSKWVFIHDNGQAGEWQVFNFAIGKNETAAYESISMGMGQIMGFNYADTGFNSAKEMFQTFSKGSKEQIKGMIKFIENNKNMLESLQDKNLRTFVKLYNGSGQIDTYLAKLQTNITKYQNDPNIINI